MPGKKRGGRSRPSVAIGRGTDGYFSMIIFFVWLKSPVVSL